VSINSNVIDLSRYLARPNLVDALNREELAALLAELKALEGKVMARLLLGATEQNPVATRAHEADRMLDVDQAAALLHKPRRWLFEHAKTLPFATRVSRKVLLCSESGLKKWLGTRRA
jgi:hypothetical protein